MFLSAERLEVKPWEERLENKHKFPLTGAHFVPKKLVLFVVTIQQVLFDRILLLQLSPRGWTSASIRLWRIPILDYNCGYKSPTNHQWISDQGKVTDHASYCPAFRLYKKPAPSTLEKSPSHSKRVTGRNPKTGDLF